MLAEIVPNHAQIDVELDEGLGLSWHRRHQPVE